MKQSTDIMVSWQRERANHTCLNYNYFYGFKTLNILALYENFTLKC